MPNADPSDMVKGSVNKKGSDCAKAEIIIAENKAARMRGMIVLKRIFTSCDMKKYVTKRHDLIAYLCNQDQVIMIFWCFCVGYRDLTLA